MINGDPQGQPSIGNQCTAWLNSIPAVTRAIILINLGIYFYSLYKPDSWEWMICPVLIYEYHQFYRLLSAAFYHLSIWHILMNMMAYVSMGSFVERSVGSLCSLGVILVFVLGSNILFTLIGWIAVSAGLGQNIVSCAAGFSGVLFGLLAIETALSPPTRNCCGMCNIPSWTYPWILLIALSVLMSNISFMGHLCGLLFGYAYAKGLVAWASIPRSTIINFENNNPWVGRFIGALGQYHPCPDVSPLQEYNFAFTRSWTWRPGGGCPSISCPSISCPSCPSISCNDCFKCFRSPNAFQQLPEDDYPRQRDNIDLEEHIVPIHQNDDAPSDFRPDSSTRIPTESRLLQPGYIPSGKPGSLAEQQRRERAKRMAQAVNKRLLASEAKTSSSEYSES